MEVGRGTKEELYASCLYNYGVGQSSYAVSSCSTLVEAYPNDHTAHSNLGWAALDADQITLASQEFGKAYTQVEDKLNTLTSTKVIDLIWSAALASYLSGDKKDCKKLLQVMRKNYPSALTVTEVQQLPLIWSNKTMTRIELVLRDLRP